MRHTAAAASDEIGSMIAKVTRLKNLEIFSERTRLLLWKKNNARATRIVTTRRPGLGCTMSRCVRRLDGVLITDVRIRHEPIVFVNDAFLRQTGYARDEILGRNSDFLQGTDSEHAGMADGLAGWAGRGTQTSRDQTEQVKTQAARLECACCCGGRHRPSRAEVG
jgi:PAS domain-containing protein